MSDYTCRRCGARRLSWEIFEAYGRYYCLGHIPRWVRLRMWLRERADRIGGAT